jgi:type I restriction enzyme S subunit
VYFFAITGGLSGPEIGDSDAKLILDDSLQAKLNYYEENSVRQGARKHAEIFQVVKRVPSHWVMVAAGDLVHLINGRAFKSTDWKKSGLPIIRIQNLNNPSAPFNYFQGEVAEGHRVRIEDMLLSWSGTPGTSFGAFIWNGGDAVLNQHIFKVAIYSAKISKEYLRMAINASLDALIGSARGGVGLKHVTKGQIESLQIPLPPLEEQKRIVAKVDELMRLCDRLEVQQQERETLLPLLSRANHTRFVAEPTESNLSAIFKESGTNDVTILRSTILALSVSGRFSESRKSDSTASELLEKIALERDRTFQPAEPPLTLSNSVQLPSAWCWARFDDVAVIASNLVQPKNFLDLPHLAPDNIEKVTGTLLPCRTVREDKVSSANHRFFAGQIVYSKIRPNLSKVVLVDFDGLCSADMYPINPLIDAGYLHLFMLSELFLSQAVRSDTRVAMPKINQKELNSIIVPVPPISEQRQIVLKHSSLAQILATLTRHRNDLAMVGEAFAHAAVAAITSTEFKENEIMKPPKTEVVTALKVGSRPKKSDMAPLATILSTQKAEASAKALWQLSGLEIDVFYRQLKAEIANGWIEEDKSKRQIKEVEVG